MVLVWAPFSEDIPIALGPTDNIRLKENNATLSVTRPISCTTKVLPSKDSNLSPPKTFHAKGRDLPNQGEIKTNSNTSRELDRCRYGSRKPLSKSEDGQPNENEAFDKHSGHSDLIWHKAGSMVTHLKAVSTFESKYSRKAQGQCTTRSGPKDDRCRLSCGVTELRVGHL